MDGLTAVAQADDFPAVGRRGSKYDEFLRSLVPGGPAVQTNAANEKDGKNYATMMQGTLRNRAKKIGVDLITSVVEGVLWVKVREDGEDADEDEPETDEAPKATRGKATRGKAASKS